MAALYFRRFKKGDMVHLPAGMYVIKHPPISTERPTLLALNDTELGVVVLEETTLEWPLILLPSRGVSVRVTSRDCGVVRSADQEGS